MKRWGPRRLEPDPREDGHSNDNQSQREVPGSGCLLHIWVIGDQNRVNKSVIMRFFFIVLA